MKSFTFAMLNVWNQIILEKNYGHLLIWIIFMTYYIDGVVMVVKSMLKN